MQLELTIAIANVRAGAITTRAPGLRAHACGTERNQHGCARAARHWSTFTPDTWICSDESMTTMRNMNPPASTSAAGSTTPWRGRR
jgi:hypothetical protein